MKRVLSIPALRDDLLQLNSRAATLCAGLTAEDLARRVEPQRWSIAENLAHLCITADTFLPAVDRAIERTRQRGAKEPGPFRLGLYGRALIRYVEPPPLIRLPAPKALRPVASLASSSAALARFLEAQHQIARRLDAADGLDLVAMRFGSPLARYVRMNLLEFFAVGNAHTRRHLWQAENVRRQLAGPLIGGKA